MLFEPCETPSVFAIPPGADFAQVLADGFLSRLKDQPSDALARIDLIVNTRRSERRLAEVFGQGQARLLPRITPISSIPERFPCPDLPPARPGLRRKFELMELIRALLEANPDLAPQTAIPSLAQSLADLFDEIQGEGVDPEALMNLTQPELSGHWQDSLRFLQIVQSYLTAQNDGMADPEARQRMAVDSLIAKWDRSPPQHPVIVAGSTGSRATTLMLMEAVSRLPQGALILPGFDFDLPQDIWTRLCSMAMPDDHPQARFAILLERLSLSRSAVTQWGEERDDSSRNRLISLALRPAPVTDAWLREGPDLGDLEQAASGVELLEAPSSRIEAQAIALRLRAALEEGQSCALITPDRMLTRQVAAALGRWGLVPDDSAGRPLALSAPGRFLSHTAELLGGELTTRSLSALLKHPLANSGEDQRGEHLRLSRELECQLRRRTLPFPTRSALQSWSEAQNADTWLDWVFKVLDGFVGIKPGRLSDILDRHIALCEIFSAGPDGETTGELWEAQAGETAHTTIQALREAAQYAGNVTLAEYRTILASALNGAEVRDPLTPHPKLMFWGTLEARVQHADLTVLAGLNEGIWPAKPDPDPWLNRSMRKQLGLLLPERRIGLSAHDFQQAAAGAQIVLSRALKDDEAETVPSRWLNRIVNLLEGLPAQGGKAALRDMRHKGGYWIGLAEQIDRAAPPILPEPRPAPRPPLAARPKGLSVTQIQRLIRDPYAIYAKEVLDLTQLDPIERRADPALRGTVLHRIVEKFARTCPNPDVENAQNILLEIAEAQLERDVPWPDVRALWQARFAAFANSFLGQEQVLAGEGTPYPRELKGRLVLKSPDFTLRGTADRIDRLNQGGLAIYDYKSGTIPNTKEVRYFDRQLLLEALIAEDGGFEDIAPESVERTGYIALGASGKSRNFRPEAGKDVDLSLPVVRAEFIRLISAYLDEGQGFTSRRAVKETRFEGDYDHLARYGEWDDADAPAPEDMS